MYKVFECENGRKIARVSRWIKVESAYGITDRHGLYYYASDCGDGEKSVDYFRFGGRKYALDQFIAMNSMFGCTGYNFIDTDGKLTFISGYDSENYYSPIMIEIEEYGDRVRVYMDA